MVVYLQTNLYMSKTWVQSYWSLNSIEQCARVLLRLGVVLWLWPYSSKETISWWQTIALSPLVSRWFSCMHPHLNMSWANGKSMTFFELKHIHDSEGELWITYSYWEVYKWGGRAGNKWIHVCLMDSAKLLTYFLEHNWLALYINLGVTGELQWGIVAFYHKVIGKVRTLEGLSELVQ